MMKRIVNRKCPPHQSESSLSEERNRLKEKFGNSLLFENINRIYWCRNNNTNVNYPVLVVDPLMMIDSDMGKQWLERNDTLARRKNRGELPSAIKSKQDICRGMSVDLVFYFGSCHKGDEPESGSFELIEFGSSRMTVYSASNNR